LPETYTPTHQNNAENIHELAKLKPGFMSVLLDMTNKCNLRCPMCHMRFDDVWFQKPVYLQPSIFENIIRSIQPYTRKLTLSAASEPLTSPYFIDNLKIVSKYEFPYINLLTNGTLLGEKIADAIVEYDVTEVCFSVHGAKRQTFKYIHGGASFDQLLKNVEYLVKKRESCEKETPRLHFNVTLMKSNIREIEDLVTLAASLGVASMAFRHLVLFKGLGMEQESLMNCKEDSNQLILKALEKAVQLDIPILNCPDFFGVDAQERQIQQAKPKARPYDILKRFFEASLRKKNLPFGFIDYPENECVSNDPSIEFSGWALSKTGIDRIEIKRKPVKGDPKSIICRDGLIYIGNAKFLNGTRADVAELFASYPFTFRCAWQFTMPHNLLPDTYKRHFEIHAIAFNVQGNRADLGNKMVRFDVENSSTLSISCAKPFDCIYIDSNASAFPYPDCDTSAPFGSLLKSSFEEIWFGQPYDTLRQNIINKTPPQMCKLCPIIMNRQVNDDRYFASRLL